MINLVKTTKSTIIGGCGSFKQTQIEIINLYNKIHISL